MKDANPFARLAGTAPLIWIGVAVSLTYWVIESFLHVHFFCCGSFLSNLLTPDAHELWKRVLVVGMMVGFSIIVQYFVEVRKQAEIALKESENKYRTIFEEAINPIFLLDDQGHFMECNKAAVEFLELTRDQLLAKNIRDIHFFDGTEHIIGNFTTDFAKKDLEIDYRMGNRVKTLLLNMVPLNIKNQEFIYGIGQDISDRKQMERTIKQAYTEMEQIFQTASVGMRLIDRDFNVLKINNTFEALSGVREADAVGKKCYHVFSGDRCFTPDCPLTLILEGKRPVECFVDKKRDDGKTVPCILTATPFLKSSGKLVGIVEAFQDITELKQAQEAIESERDKLRHILSHLVEGVSIVNSRYAIEYCNDVFREYAGSCEGRPCYAAFLHKDQPCDECLMHKAINNRQKQQVELENSEGRSFEKVYTPMIDVDGEEKVTILIRDVTDKKLAMSAIMRAEQLAALAELAAGVAHEVNNPINGIINYAQILINKSDGGSLIRDLADRVLKESNRIAKIVQGLLTFARQNKEEKSIISIEDLINDSLELTSFQMHKHNIVVKTDFAEDIPKIEAQAQEIRQVFVNIISNAIHALNQKYPKPHDNKVLEIFSKTVNDNSHACIQTQFVDRGIGIPKEIFGKVKTPFFSTKTDSTGLGLSISHGIIENHNGSLTIDSVEGDYTRVTVEIPV